jgi:sec-independent protein translocase protein TatA
MTIMTNSFLNTILMSMPGGSEWILIILVVLLLFGGKKIPELMRGVGRGMREFNDAKNNVKNEIEEGMKDKEYKQEIKKDIRETEIRTETPRP